MKLQRILTIFAAVFIVSCMVGVSFGQEMPKPGMTIDKSNYKKYAHLFPAELLPAFENGFGLVPPFKVNVVAPIPIVVPDVLTKYSEKNKGKYGLDAQGNVTGGYARVGVPFPDLKASDKDFATKFMWNYDCNWFFDENWDGAKGGSFEKRKGEDVRWNNSHLIFVYWKNRQIVNPKPDLANPLGLYKSTMIHFVRPDSVKNTINLTYRYVDPKKPDDTYLYLPSLRRVLRAEAGQRSTPLLGNIAALDDMFGFDGRTPEFTYTLVGEQKVLAVTDNKTHLKSTTWKSKELPQIYDGFELQDVYVIDIKPKDPKYPQSKKRIWITKDSQHIVYVVAWDRAGKPWKVWTQYLARHPMLGQSYPVLDAVWGVDLQFGMSTFYFGDIEVNKKNYTYSDWSTNALLKIAR